MDKTAKERHPFAEIAKQLTRIADAMERNNTPQTMNVSDSCVVINSTISDMQTQGGKQNDEEFAGNDLEHQQSNRGGGRGEINGHEIRGIEDDAADNSERVEASGANSVAADKISEIDKTK